MPSTRLYAGIYVVLFVFATAQVAFEFTGLLESAYWLAFGGIILLSLIKALFVAGYYQHLRYEPRSITFVVLSGLITALVLTIAASYSIT
ncbi:cytochrome C oxidase subunit IV family protein [Halococcus agarilyticus]|uniref:cytochrome C oxidase subunit IV family protein n=1 Tax=Halococcus agarilyticus TaxID=1232219 RepID=UPI0006781385|nr:cytochrome C oxidase subunit IV family protein [Halococcus agarilyticus]